MSLILLWIGLGLIAAGAQARHYLESSDLTYRDLIALAMIGIILGPVMTIIVGTAIIKERINENIDKVVIKKRGKK